MNYKIYQTDPKTCEYCFDWWDWAKDYFNFKDYTLVYEGEVPETDTSKPDTYILEMLFIKFNIARPEDFKGHSLSVSDIVELDGKYYYCDNVGWTEITKYIK